MSFDPSGRKPNFKPNSKINQAKFYRHVSHRQQDRFQDLREIPPIAAAAILSVIIAQRAFKFFPCVLAQRNSRTYLNGVIGTRRNTMLGAHHHNNIAPLLTLGIWAAAFVWFIAWIG
jgi:hypothetical protein